MTLHPKTYLEELILTRPENRYKAGLCLCFLPYFSHYQDTVRYLHPEELNYYQNLKFERRIRSYLLGRYAAKKAAAALTKTERLEEILVQPGVFTQPVVTLQAHPNIQATITHCEDLGGAIVFPEAHPLGIDIEKAGANSVEALESQMTDAEKALVRRYPESYEFMLTLLWTGKEALSKILKTGLMTSFKILEVNKIELKDGYWLSFYKNFGQYKAISFKLGRYICSITFPLKTELAINLDSIRSNFDFLNQMEENQETG
ncbi:MAG: 4'-phosphopantetheinyl transferase superfamily protein [Firmicutes bacterium]|nr:4'-phosphopantetheinyl transferase superfamily protein [Bacillota bacterium]